MPPRTLASLAQSLSVATDVEGALKALADSLAELDRSAQLALVRFDARRGLMRERLSATPDSTDRTVLDTTLDHLPPRERVAITAGGQFVDFAAASDENARLFALIEQPRGVREHRAPRADAIGRGAPREGDSGNGEDGEQSARRRGPD